MASKFYSAIVVLLTLVVFVVAQELRPGVGRQLVGVARLHRVGNTHLRLSRLAVLWSKHRVFFVLYVIESLLSDKLHHCGRNRTANHYFVEGH